jgi:SAM-dependent methyltransferase
MNDLGIQKIYKLFIKTPLIHKLFYLFTIVLITNIITSAYHNKNKKEGFEGKYNINDQELNGTKFITKYGTDLYDDFYVQIYDDLVFSKIKDNFEVTEIIKSTNPSKSSYILDIGSGTGHHVKNLSDNGYKSIGIDLSNAMVTQSKKNYPDMKYLQGDCLDAILFQANLFSHITCLYFTVYYIENKRQFFTNCMTWLKPGGFLALHLVNRTKFDPIIPAGCPFGIVSPQTYAKQRITSSAVVFDQFEYKSNFEFKLEDDEAYLHETFKYKNGKVRKNEHKFYMETQKKIKCKCFKYKCF